MAQACTLNIRRRQGPKTSTGETPKPQDVGLRRHQTSEPHHDICHAKVAVVSTQRETMLVLNIFIRDGRYLTSKFSCRSSSQSDKARFADGIASVERGIMEYPRVIVVPFSRIFLFLSLILSNCCLFQSTASFHLVRAPSNS